MLLGVRLVKRVAVVAVSVAALVGVAGCGGGGGLAPDTVADVGGTPITVSALNHWIGTITGGDFMILSGLHVSKELVAEPFNAERCERELQALTTNPPKPAKQPSAAWLNKKCQELRGAIKRQALQELIAAHVGFGRGTEEGLSVTPAELKAELKRFEAEQFPSSTAFAAYLSARDWSVSDELLIIKKDVISQKLSAKAAQRFGASEAARAAHSKEAVAKWVAKTTCRPGFIVEGCKAYTKKISAAVGPSAAALIEEIARLHGRAKHLAPDLNCRNTKGGHLSCHGASASS